MIAVGYESFPNTGDTARASVAGNPGSCARVDGPCTVRNDGPGPVAVAVVEYDGGYGDQRAVEPGATVDVDKGVQVDVWAVGAGGAGLLINRTPESPAVPYTPPEPVPDPEPEPEPDRKVLVHEGSQSRYVDDTELVNRAAAKKSVTKKRKGEAS